MDSLVVTACPTPTCPQNPGESKLSYFGRSGGVFQRTLRTEILEDERQLPIVITMIGSMR
jgi:hypothetical protein